jgi:prepilin-type N-terminal cleavage/methylation domain-containing protein
MGVMNTLQKSQQSGFTVIELVVVAVVVGIAAVVTFVQMNSLTVASDDSQRKTAINSMYYALEEVYYKQNNSYPATLDTKTLPSVDPELFTDPDGFTLGKEILTEDELQKLVDEGNTTPATEQRLNSLNAGKQPNYHYDPTNCDASGHCKSYTLRADLVGEAQYVKKSRSH